MNELININIYIAIGKSNIVILFDWNWIKRCKRQDFVDCVNVIMKFDCIYSVFYKMFRLFAYIVPVWYYLILGVDVYNHI